MSNNDLFVYPLNAEWQMDRIAPLWYIFGKHEASGNVDLAANGEDWLCSVPEETAHKLIAIQGKYRAELEALLFEEKGADL